MSVPAGDTPARRQIAAATGKPWDATYQAFVPGGVQAGDTVPVYYGPAEDVPDNFEILQVGEADEAGS